MQLNIKRKHKYYNKVIKKVTVKSDFRFQNNILKEANQTTVKRDQRALKNNGYYLTAYGHYLKVDVYLLGLHCKSCETVPESQRSESNW